MQVNVKPGTKVAIGFPIYGDIPYPTVASLCDTFSYAAASGIQLGIIKSSSAFPLNRDFVLDEFLKGDWDKLLWIDSDMVWKHADFATMVALSCLSGVDIVMATYPTKTDDKRQYHFNIPANAKRHPDVDLIECNGGGLGFTIINRAPLEKLTATMPDIVFPSTGDKFKRVFRFDTPNGVLRGEDYAFFADLQYHGYTVWMAPFIELGHVGTKIWRGKASEIRTKDGN
jgi:hypothetical protein